MLYWCELPSPLGRVTLSSRGAELCGLQLPDQCAFHPDKGEVTEEIAAEELPVFVQTARWLDTYFAGEKPEPLPPLALAGTPFRRLIWSLLMEIPYGYTVTYGALAQQAAGLLGKARMSAQAVGGAVGHNPVSILVPCHRVIGSDGAMVGYGGHLEQKIALLALEQGDENWQRATAAWR